MENSEIIKQLNSVISAVKTIPVNEDYVYTIIAIRNTLNNIISTLSMSGGE